jgi:hypothetical protein
MRRIRAPEYASDYEQPVVLHSRPVAVRLSTFVILIDIATPPFVLKLTMVDARQNDPIG